MIYLGRESFDRIDKTKSVGYGLYFDKFLGEMHWGENKCINPTIDIIPERYEIFDENGHSDVRAGCLDWQEDVRYNTPVDRSHEDSTP